METKNTPSLEAAQVAFLQEKLKFESAFKNGVNWFFWIAGLSLLNTIIYLTGSSLTFVIGLGVTQFVDGLTSAVAASLNQGGIIIRMIGLVIDIFVSGIFVTFGVLGRKRLRWAIILGMVLYAIDGLIVLLFKDFFGAAFHAWAFFGISMGLHADSQLRALEQAGESGSSADLSRQLAGLQKPARSRKQTGIRLIIIGLIFLAIMAFFVFVGVQQ